MDIHHAEFGMTKCPPHLRCMLQGACVQDIRLQPETDSQCITFDGINIDCHEIRRRCYEQPVLAYLVSRCRGLGKQVLVEGIETEADLRYAQASGANIGQGFYWPETVLDLPRPLRGLL